MLKRANYFLLACLLLCGAALSQTSYYSQKIEEQKKAALLKNKVRSVKIYYYDCDRETGDIIKDSLQLTYKEYDREGNEIKYISYKKGNRDSISWMYESRYDKKGNETWVFSFDEEGKGEETYRNKYDRKGNLIEILQLDSSGKVVSREMNSYDKYGYRTEMKFYHDDKTSFMRRETFEYDAKHNVIAQHIYDSSSLYKSFSVKTDSLGRLAEMTEYYKKTDHSRLITWTYKEGGIEEELKDEWLQEIRQFDQQGLLVKETKALLPHKPWRIKIYEYEFYL